MRFLVRACAALVVGIVAMVGLTVSGHAAAPAPVDRVAAVDTHSVATCDFDIGGKHDVVLAVPREALGGGLGCADVRSQIRVGPPTQQNSPGSSSTTWSWEICIWVWSPSGIIFEWCFKITIKTSTTVPNGNGTIDVRVLSANHGSSPVKVCFEEKLPDGTIAKHCIEITIDVGDPND